MKIRKKHRNTSEKGITAKITYIIVCFLEGLRGRRSIFFTYPVLRSIHEACAKKASQSSKK
jgi:hypothetical protein